MIDLILVTDDLNTTYVLVDAKESERAREKRKALGPSCGLFILFVARLVEDFKEI